MKIYITFNVIRNKEIITCSILRTLALVISAAIVSHFVPRYLHRIYSILNNEISTVEEAGKKRGTFATIKHFAMTASIIIISTFDSVMLNIMRLISSH